MLIDEDARHIPTYCDCHSYNFIKEGEPVTHETSWLDFEPQDWTERDEKYINDDSLHVVNGYGCILNGTKTLYGDIWGEPEPEPVKGFDYWW